MKQLMENNCACQRSSFYIDMIKWLQAGMAIITP